MGGDLCRCGRRAVQVWEKICTGMGGDLCRYKEEICTGMGGDLYRYGMRSVQV